MTLELRCSRDLALRLGAVTPETTKHHREMRDAGDLLVRDGQTGWAMFWKWELLPGQRGMEILRAKSS